MDEKGKKKFKWDLEKFVVTRLRSFSEFPYIFDFVEFKDYFSSAKSRNRLMDKCWECYQYRNRNRWRELAEISQLTNQEICHEMF